MADVSQKTKKICVTQRSSTRCRLRWRWKRENFYIQRLRYTTDNILQNRQRFYETHKEHSMSVTTKLIATARIKVHLVLVSLWQSESEFVLSELNRVPSTWVYDGERVYDAIIRLFGDYSGLEQDYISFKQILCFDTKKGDLIMNVVAKAVTQQNLDVKLGKLVSVSKLESLNEETKFILSEALIS